MSRTMNLEKVSPNNFSTLSFVLFEFSVLFFLCNFTLFGVFYFCFRKFHFVVSFVSKRVHAMLLQQSGEVLGFHQIACLHVVTRLKIIVIAVFSPAALDDFKTTYKLI